MVKNAPVLRVEKAERKTVRLKLLQKQQTVAFVVAIKIKAIWRGDVWLDSIPSITENCFIARRFNVGSHNVVKIGFNLLNKL